MLYTRILLSLSLSALRAAYIAINGINNVKDLFVLLAAVISYPALTFAFYGYFDRKKELCPKKYDMALLAFAFSFTLVLLPYELGGISLAVLIGAAFTLCAARTRGFGFGGVCGIICGIACGGEATGALGVLGMSYGLLVTELEPLALVLSYMLAVSGFIKLSFCTLICKTAFLCYFAGCRIINGVCNFNAINADFFKQKVNYCT